MKSKKIVSLAIAASPLLLGGCAQWFIDEADREVATLIEQRQRESLGFTTNSNIGRERGMVTRGGDRYSFSPSPVAPDVPDEFRRATFGSEDEAAAEDGVSAGTEDQGEAPIVTMDRRQGGATKFVLSDVLAYAQRHSRRYQTEKELLYLSGLDLTLERFLWTPRFVEDVLRLDYQNAGQSGNFDQSLSAIASFAVEQRLPYGGEITARVVDSFMRDITRSVTTGESGDVTLDARIPLLRGAGPPAYEPRYQAERDLVYAIRNFERFRRSFLVDISSDFFDLLSQQAQIKSADAQAESLKHVYIREQALADAGRRLQLDADRAQVSVLTAQDTAQRTRARYRTSLDGFKIRLGMPTVEEIELVADDAVELTDPRVEPGDALETALRYRLDLVSARDRVDDARRAVTVAKNNLLPQLDIRGGVAMDTDPTGRNRRSYNSERARWSAGVDLEIPLNRKRERNDYRSALISLRRAQRDFDQASDNVRLDVRRAMRGIASAFSSMEIQREQIRINEFRAEMADAQLKAGQLASTLNVVDAQEDLSRARNGFAEAESVFRRAILEFLRDTGTLRVSDAGRWVTFDRETGEPIVSNTDATGS